MTDPKQVFEGFNVAETLENYDTIVVDGLNYLMDMYESLYVLTSADTRSAWSDYAQYFKALMQQYVASSSKNVIFTAHTLTTYNETAMAMETKVPIKGALKNQGVESYFSVIVAAKKKAIKDLEPYQSELLNITDRERALGYKHVFQTQVTPDTITERIRAPMGLFTDEETFIDNDINLVLQRLREFFGETV